MLDSATPVPHFATAVSKAVTHPTQRRRRSALRPWLIIGIPVVLIGTGFAAFYLRGTHPGLLALQPQSAVMAPLAVAPSQAAPLPTLTVGAAIVAPQPMLRTIVGDGSVVAWQELAIGAEIGGLRVVEVAVEEGDEVLPGQLLVRFDSGVLAAQAAQAEAAVAEAEAILQVARSDLGRATELSREAITTRQTVEQRHAVWRQAEARLASARARRDEFTARLAQTRVLAPAAGVIARRSVLLGTVPVAGQEMARIIRDNRMELEAKLPELDIAVAQPGQPVRVWHGDRAIDAEVRSVAPIVASDTRQGIVHIRLPDDSGLRPGMFARAEIRVAETQAILVPQAAVVFRAGFPTAFVLNENGRASLRQLVTGSRHDGLVQIISGLIAGEQVVVSGAGFLSDGDHVQIARPNVIAAF